MEEAVKKVKKQKYVARRFVPKAYYNFFDWEHYVPGQAYEENKGPKVERNPLADPKLNLVQKKYSGEIDVNAAAEKAAARAAASVQLRMEEEIPEEVHQFRKEQAAAVAASESVHLRFEEKSEEKVFNGNEKIIKPAEFVSEPENFSGGTGAVKEGSFKKAGDAAAEVNRVENSKAKKLGKTKDGTEKVPIFRSIGAKLIVIISSIVVVSLIGITVLVSQMFSADTKVNALDNNLTINSRTSADTQNRLGAVETSVGMFLDILNGAGDSAVQQRNRASVFFDRNKEICAIVLPQSGRTFVNSRFFMVHELDSSILDSYIESEAENIKKAKQGDRILENASPVFGTSLISFFYPLENLENDNCVVVFYSTEALADTYSASSINLSYFVNRDGKILIHPDIQLSMEGADFNNTPLVDIMQESLMDAQQITYMQNGEEYIGAYQKIDNGTGAVLTTVKTSVILEAVNKTTRRNIYLTFAVLAVAILIIYFFAKSLSTPLRSLTKVVNEINKGNFNTEAFEELTDYRNDEVGVLIRSTKNERQILNTFTKMTNRGVTNAIITKQIDFDPHLKDITIFFSDIRGFTAISDGFKNRFEENSAGEIINFLNDYMGRMVNCITLTGGNVDKFEGDAIMACWGVLREDSLAFETMDDSDPEKEKLKQIHDRHVTNDALSAIKATTAMRYALAVYNKEAEIFTKAHENEPLAKYKPHIRIGAGLNSGRATVGFMGSRDKMEFTSIGDAVNLASRTESSNKPCGTDILITEDTYNLLKMNYIRCEENNFSISPEFAENEILVERIPVSFEVKGKGKQHFYGVVNMPAFNIEEFFKQGDPDFQLDLDCAKVIGPDGPETLDQVRELLGIPKPDFNEVDLDKEENKIQIQTK